MSTLLLVGASGLAKEVLAVERTRPSYANYAVLDDDPRTWGRCVAGAPVVGSLEEVRRFSDASIVVCVGNGATRRGIVDRLTKLGVEPGRFARVLHPSVHIPVGCTVGRGSVLLAQVTLTADVRVGSHVVVMPQVTLTHDDAVDDFATLAAGVSLGGSVAVGQAVYIGMNASVREGLTLGTGSTLGMGSVLLDDLPPGGTWVGVPARPLRRVCALPRESA